MKLRYITILSMFAILVGTVSCNNDKQCDATSHEGHDHAKEEAIKETEESHNEDHSEEIILSPEKAKRFGVKSSIITPSQFNKVIKVSGEIIPSQGDVYQVAATSNGIVKLSKNIAQGIAVKAGQIIGSISAKGMTGGDMNEAAKVSYLAAKRELDRIKPLYKDKIITEREYIIAQENYEKARLAYNPASNSGSTAHSAISGTLVELSVKDGQYVEAGMPIATISKNAKLVLRADLPERYYNQLSSINSANFKTTYNDNIYSIKDMGGRVISSNNAVATAGYIPVLFEFNNNGTLASGSFAEIYLIGNNNKANVLAIPNASVTEELGKYYIYIQLDDEGYEKRLVTIGESDGRNVEILSGLKSGEKVVTDGAVFVKLAANSGEVPEGCSHNH